MKVNLSMDRRYCQMEEKSSPLQEVKPLANETTIVKGEKNKRQKDILIYISLERKPDLSIRFSSSLNVRPSKERRKMHLP